MLYQQEDQATVRTMSLPRQAALDQIRVKTQDGRSQGRVLRVGGTLERADAKAQKLEAAWHIQGLLGLRRGSSLVKSTCTS